MWCRREVYIELIFNKNLSVINHQAKYCLIHSFKKKIVNKKKKFI